MAAWKVKQVFLKQVGQKFEHANQYSDSPRLFPGVLLLLDSSVVCFSQLGSKSVSKSPPSTLSGFVL